MIRTPVCEPLGTIGAINQVHHQLTDESAREIVRRLVAEAEEALKEATRFVS